jgi:hypothetical protein
MGGLFGGSNSNNSGGGQFNSGPVATVGANDFGSFGSQGSSVFDQSPSGVVGDPFFDPVFGSQLLSGQSGQQGFTPATGIGEPAQYTREPQTTATDTAATSQQQQQRQPLVEASTGLQQVAKLLRGNQQPQGPGWIQPQQQQAPQIPPQVANAMARDQSGGPPQPQLPQLPETPAAQPVPLPRRRPSGWLGPSGGCGGRGRWPRSGGRSRPNRRRTGHPGRRSASRWQFPIADHLVTAMAEPVAVEQRGPISVRQLDLPQPAKDLESGQTTPALRTAAGNSGGTWSGVRRGPP